MRYEIKEGSYVNDVNSLLNNGYKIKVLAVTEDDYALFRINGEFCKEKIENLRFNGNEPAFSF